VRDAGLGQTDDGRELGDVQPFAIDHAKQAKSGLVPEQTVERGRLMHIYKSTPVDVILPIDI
jgi:hypothetical protein